MIPFALPNRLRFAVVTAHPAKRYPFVPQAEQITWSIAEGEAPTFAGTVAIDGSFFGQWHPYGIERTPHAIIHFAISLAHHSNKLVRDSFRLRATLIAPSV